jgi:hypothetical protein
MFEALSEEPYRFPYYLLAWSVTVALMGLVLFPWAMFAYKIWHGNKPIDDDLREELLKRSWYFGWALAAAAAVFALVDYVLVDADWLGLPAGPMHIILLLSFLALAAWWMMYFFSLEDFFQGLMLALIYLYLPTALLVVTWGHRWNILFTYVLSWLKDPKPV